MDSLEYVNVSSYSDPKDYINSEGLNKCFDVGPGEYATSYNDEEFFASFDSNSIVIASINENGKFLFNGNIDPVNAIKLLSLNNFIDNSTIYLYADEKLFDSLSFSSIIDKVSNSSSLITIPNFNSSDFEHSIYINDSSLSISSDRGEVISYDISRDKKTSRSK